MATLARCTHRNDVGLRDCFVPALLMVTKSPMREYEYLVVERCPQHLIACWGVVECEAAPPIDDGPEDCWGAF